MHDLIFIWVCSKYRCFLNSKAWKYNEILNADIICIRKIQLFILYIFDPWNNKVKLSFHIQGFNRNRLTQFPVIPVHHSHSIPKSSQSSRSWMLFQFVVLWRRVGKFSVYSRWEALCLIVKYLWKAEFIYKICWFMHWRKLHWKQQI